MEDETSEEGPEGLNFVISTVCLYMTGDMVVTTTDTTLGQRQTVAGRHNGPTISGPRKGRW